MFALANVFTNCSESIKVTLCILHRSDQSLSKYPWLTLLRSPFGFSLAWRCQALDFIQQLLPCGTLLPGLLRSFLREKLISCDPQRFLARARGPFCRALSNRPCRLLEELLDIHALSPWSWRALSAGMCVSSSISMSAEYHDWWGCQNGQATPTLLMSGVLQLSSSAFMWNTSFGLCRFRRQRIEVRHCYFLGRVDVFGQGLETGFASRVVLCPGFDAVPLEKGGHTRCAGERRDPRAAFRRAGV